MVDAAIVKAALLAPREEENTRRTSCAIHVLWRKWEHDGNRGKPLEINGSRTSRERRPFPIRPNDEIHQRLDFIEQNMVAGGGVEPPTLGL